MKSLPQKLSKFVRIICEGEETEPKYFRGLIKDLNLKGIAVKRPKDNSPLGIVREARDEYQIAIQDRILKKDIEVWAMFDRNGHPKLAEAFTMARDNNIRIAFSSVCFEYWILLHYEYTTRHFSSSEEIEHYIRKKYDPGFHKANDHYYHLKNRLPEAIKHNKLLLENHCKIDLDRGEPVHKLSPYCDVYKLVELLQGK